MYRPVLDAVAGSIFLTALVAMLPLLTLFVLLGVLRISAWKAALASLLVSVLVAIVVYSMPAGQAIMAGAEGAAFGFFPILWIVINAIWLYNMTVVTGHFDVLRRSFAKVSDDQRIQADHHRVLLRRAPRGARRLRHPGGDHRASCSSRSASARSRPLSSRSSPTPHLWRSAPWPCRSRRSPR